MFENQLLLEASLEPCWLGQLQKLTAQGRNGEMVTAQGVQKPEKLLWDGLLLAATRLSFSYVCVWMNRCSRWYCIGTCMICICRAYYVRYGLQNAKQANSWLEVIHKQAYIYMPTDVLPTSWSRAVWTIHSQRLRQNCNGHMTGQTTHGTMGAFRWCHFGGGRGVPKMAPPVGVFFNRRMADQRVARFLETTKTTLLLFL